MVLAGEDVTFFDRLGNYLKPPRKSDDVAPTLDADAYEFLRAAKCSACGAHLYRIDDGVPAVATPFAAHVVSRQKDLSEPGEKFKTTEIPQICSRACLHKIVASYDFRDDANNVIPSIYGNLSIVENERLVLMWGTEIPEVPT